MGMLLDEMLSRLIHASLQAILLCGAIYVVCRLVPAMSASAKTVLWWLLGAQLVVGVISPTLIALPVLPAIATVTAADDATAVMPLTLPGAFPAASLVPPASNVTGDAGFSWEAMLLFAWALGVIVQAVVAVSRWRTLAGVAARAMPHDDVRVETLCARRARELGLRRSPRLAVSTEVHSPQVIGFWRPTILLPLHDYLADDELDLALMHELAHVRRGDLILGWIPATARTLFFFHPLVHVAVREYAVCREAACDALVVSRGDTLAQTYGRLLVRMGVAPHPHHALPGASPTFRTLKRRLLMLAQANDSHPRMLTLCLVTLLTLAGVFPWRVVAAPQSTQPAPARAAVAAAPTATAAPATVMTANDSVPARPAAPAAPMRTAVTPVTPATPVTPMTRVTPVTPVAPGTSTWRTTDITEIHGRPTDGFVFSSDDIHVATGTESDLARAEAAYRADAKSFVWYRQGTQAWILRDPAYIERIHAAYQQVSHPADRGAASAGMQADIDRQEAMLERQQATLNEQMAKLSAQQASLVSREVGPSGPRDGAAYAAGHAAIAREQAAVAQKMAALGQQRAVHGKAMAEWGRRQSEASRKASEEVNIILAEAIRNHVAQPAR